MTEFDPSIKAALDRIQPPASAHADWADVVARHRRRRMYVAAIATALAAGGAVALAAPPLSLGERLFVTVEDKPAPARVKDHFRWGNEAREQRSEVIEWNRPASELPHVRAEETRAVLSIATERGKAILWAAPADDGRWCFIVQRTWETDAAEGPLESSCTSQPPRPLETHDVSSVRSRGDWLLAGVIAEGLDVELHLGGETVTPRVVEGFFLAEFPADAKMVEVVASDGDEVVARERLERALPAPLFKRPPPEAYRPVATIDLAPGVPFGFAVAAAPEAVCLGFFLGKEQRAFLRGRIGLQGGCGRAPAEVHWDVQEEVASERPDSRPQPFAVLYGVATPAVERLELTYEDGVRQSVELYRKPLGLFDRYFVFSIPKEHFERGRVPSTLTARDTNGAIVFADRLG
ncbi:MAG: hypothetical protein ICV59_02625 [Thermoleophilia bacterium]|nr:hypothetical protein [Thermoleophilia bacterium]